MRYYSIIPPPHSTSSSVYVCLGSLFCARTYNSAVYLISSRYGPYYPRLRLTVTNAVPVLRDSNRTFFYAQTMRTRLVFDYLLPSRPLLLPLYFLSLSLSCRTIPRARDSSRAPPLRLRARRCAVISCCRSRYRTLRALSHSLRLVSRCRTPRYSTPSCSLFFPCCVYLAASSRALFTA